MPSTTINPTRMGAHPPEGTPENGAARPQAAEGQAGRADETVHGRGAREPRFAPAGGGRPDAGPQRLYRGRRAYVARNAGAGPFIPQTAGRTGYDFSKHHVGGRAAL